MRKLRLSLSRAEAKNLKALHTKKGRRLVGRFLAEGVRLLEEAQRFRVRPVHVYWASSLLSDRGEVLLEQYRQSRVPTTSVTASELGRLASTETTQGIVAVFATPTMKSAELDLSARRSVLLCENISDPGNLGALIRSAAAFDFDPVVLVGTCAEPYSPKVVRASAGAIFGVAVFETTVDEIASRARQAALRLLATSTKGVENIGSALSEQSDCAIMLAIGSEAGGLSDRITAESDNLVRIDHTDRVESLNAAIAGSILMKECYERRTQR